MMMFKLLLQALIVGLGFNKPKMVSLYPRSEEFGIMNLRNPRLVFLLIALAIIVFAVIVVLFTVWSGVSMVESGTVYNGSWA